MKAARVAAYTPALSPARPCPALPSPAQPQPPGATPAVCSPHLPARPLCCGPTTCCPARSSRSCAPSCVARGCCSLLLSGALCLPVPVLPSILWPGLLVLPGLCAQPGHFGCWVCTIVHACDMASRLPYAGLPTGCPPQPSCCQPGPQLASHPLLATLASSACLPCTSDHWPVTDPRTRTSRIFPASDSRKVNYLYNKFLLSNPRGGIHVLPPELLSPRGSCPWPAGGVHGGARVVRCVHDTWGMSMSVSRQIHQ